VGLRSWLTGRKPVESDEEKADRLLGPGGDWAFAVLRVTAVDRPPDPTAVYQWCLITGVLTFDLRPAQAVREQYFRVPSSKWLRPGDEVPVVVRLSYLAEGRAGAISVLWDKLPERSALHASSADAMAAQLRGEQASQAGDDRYRTGTFDDPDRLLPGSSGGGTTVQQADALLYSGVPATGTVLSVVDVNVPRLLRATVPAGATLADLTLRVSTPEGGSYEVRTRIGFSTQHRRSVVAVEGATLPIRVDPLDANKIAVDTVALGFAPEVRHRKDRR
jgi:hypothetical protein